jgi:hypothetical protein
MTTLDRMEEWTRRNTDGSRTLEQHIWISDLETPPRPRRRAADAAAGAEGEVRTNTPLPGDPDTPPEQRGRQDQQQPAEYGGPRETGGLPAAHRGQSAEPPTFIDSRSLRVRVSGRDQRGQNWEQLVYGHGGVEAPTDWPQLSPGDAVEKFEATDALRDLAGAAGRHEVRGLGQLQRLLDLTYGWRRRP